MLILSRRIGEIIRVDQKIQIIALNIGTNQIRLGIEAPNMISILRKELYKRKKIKKPKLYKNNFRY